MLRKTPGIYIKDLTPPQPADPFVESALPAFIGHTEFAIDGEGKGLDFQAFRVRDIDHFSSFFGGAYRPDSYHVVVDPSNEYAVVTSKPDKKYYLYECLQQYFDNGGGDCFIISVGSYKDPISLGKAEGEGEGGLLKGVKVAEKTTEITLILYPDAVELSDAVELGALHQATLTHCFEQKNRFLIADIKENEDWRDAIADFRQASGINQLKYGAAYFPWIYSSYEHQFHFRELKFWENESRSRILDYSLFSNTSDLELAKKHQEMVSRVIKEGSYIQNIVQSLGIDYITRDNLSPLTKHWEQNSSKLSKATNDEERKQILTANLNVLSKIIASFAKLDDRLSDDLDDFLFKLKGDARFIKGIAMLIGIHKAAANQNLLQEDIDPTQIIGTYQVLAGTNWLTYEKIKDVPEFEAWGDVLSLEIKDQINFVQDQINPLAREFALALGGLFDLAVSYEAIAEEILFREHPFFNRVFEHLNLQLKKLPPSGTMAGIYSATDRTKGVWKAPANVRLQSTLGPVIEIDDHDQEELNVHTSGKSINVIRPFRGRGIRIWGARTLAGNDNEWRYVPVRRFFSYVEDFVKLAAEPFVFEPNDANTWMKFRFMLDNFLTTQWRKGALVGISTDEAYYINLGLGESMTSQDILEGRMIVEVGMAVARPAEFIVIRYLCHMEEN